MFENNPICKLLNIKYPIFQGGMAWLGTAELAAAVSNAGGLGIIGAGHMPPDLLRAEIQKVKQWTDKPFGVNIMLLSPFADDIVDLVIEEGVKVVTTGAGNPGKYMDRFHEAGITVIPVVPSVALAKRMEKLGMVLDFSHLNDKSFWDLMSIATTPVIASHSNSRTVCPAKRNLTDDMLKEIAKTGGLVGMNSLREFVSEKREEQNVQKLCDHLDYIANLIGIDHIGLGYDFDGYLGGEALGSFSSNLDSPSADGVSNEAEAYNLILEMKKRGYSQEDCDKVAYKNFYRVFKQVLK